MRPLRLGFHYHVPAVGKNGGTYLPGFFGRFVDSLAENCQTLVCFFHAASLVDATMCDYQLESPNLQWVDLGPMHSAPYRTFFSKRFTRIAAPHLISLDAILLRGPSPLLPAMAAAAQECPVILLLVGDYLAGINSTRQPLLRKWLIRLWATWNTHGQLQAAKRSLTLVNSHKLYNDLQFLVPNLVEVHTTTLTQDDFFERVDTCQTFPVRLFYAGRLSAAKGLFDVLTAMGKLVSQGEDLVFDFAGWPEPAESDIVERMSAFANGHGLAGRLNYLGYKSLGPDLLACYRQADIFVLASTSDFEGFPRAIWEAMANSLPVAASRTGSIPAYTEGAAELFAPARPDDLVAALSRLLHQPELRQKYIRNGLVLAHQNSLNVQTKKMVEAINRWVER